MTTENMAPLLQAIGISKTYPGGVVANDNVNIAVNAGEVHAVVGENGAGKSTLMKILFGVEQADSGELRLAGEQVRFGSPRAAINAGIGMVFQHFSLVPSFSAYENIVLGSEPRSGIRFNRRKAIEEVRALSARFRLHVDPLQPVRQLPVGQQQRVEILKALYRGGRILILDEPTAVLTPQEVTELFSAIRALVAQGRTVIFIAHKLPEVLEISSRITVMRGGKTIGEIETKDATEQKLANMMVGREVTLRVQRKPYNGKVTLAVNRLSLMNELRATVCDDVSLTVRSGEIVGLAGVAGNGQAELIEAIAGLRSVAGGDIAIGGESILPLGVRARRGKDMASIPEDRISQGLALGASVAENLVATRLDDRLFARGGLLDLGEMRANAERLIERFSIRIDGPKAVAATLSGGNMQKVVVARELSEQPRLLLVSQPTRGVDLASTQFIWRILTETRNAGAAVLLSSADLSELLALSDRLMVFYRGRVVAAFRNSDELTTEMLGACMLGLSRQSPEEMRAALA